MRPIDADAAVERIKEVFELFSENDALPAAAVAKWIETFFTSEKHTPTLDIFLRGAWQVIRDGRTVYKCSRCGKQMTEPANFCPVCGSSNKIQEVTPDDP